MTPNHIGQQFGNYRLLRLIGEGGFAHVYLGEHIHLGTQAAVKILTTVLIDDEIAQFRNEARIIISMDHPHIVRVLDFGMQDSIPYIVMVYAPNGSLRSLHTQESQLTLPLIITYMNQIASALQYIHNRKLIHRDVKPENMLVCQNGAIALSDFGIAIIAHSERSLSQQDLGGTSIYMAPEQFQGKPRPASDQYALGIIAYEWLCGTPPFQGNIAQLAYQHSYVSPQPLREKICIAPRVEEVIFKAIAKDPQDRFERVQDFALALNEASQTDLSAPANGSWHTLPVSAPLTLSSRSTKAGSASILPQSTVSPDTFVEQGLTQQPSVGMLSESSIPTVSSKYRVIPPAEQGLSTLFTPHHASLQQPPLPSAQALSLPPAESITSAPLPGMPRPAHPRRQVRRTKRWPGMLTFVLAIGLVLAIGAGVMLSLGSAVLNNFIHPGNTGNSGGSASTAADFLGAITHQDYSRAFLDLDATLTIVTTLTDFSQQAQHDDHCYGRVTDYNETATNADTQGNQHVTYTLTREKLTKPYALILTLIQDSWSGKWLITSYGPDLGPSPPTCA